jgi:type II secretory pathway pseudopilin PulG
MTLVELMIVMIAIGILSGMILRGPDPGQFRRVHGEAQALRAAMVAALVSARAEEGDAVFYVDPTPSGTARGRFLALTGPPGTVRDTLPGGAAWKTLEGGVQWGWGVATTAPGGGAPLPMLGTVRCEGGASCWLGGRSSAVYYLTHARQPASVDAVVLTTEGDVQLFHLEPGTGRWIPGLR